MSLTEPVSEGTIYTIGHSNHPIETFLDLLRQYRIQVLIDTRSAPFSRYSPHFNRAELKAALQAEGIKYGFYGRELGGRPEDEDFYDENGHVLYGQVAKSFLFNEALERLTRGIVSHKTALLCSEENPSICHRRLLITRVLFEQGVDVYHIRGNGTVQSERELRFQEEENKGAHSSLFGEEEVPEWKSIQSVLHKAQRHTFLDG